MVGIPDFLVVGSGLTGAVFARVLYDAGYSVLVLDRRPAIGGNVYDYDHHSGICVNQYGPHYFRTSNEAVWRFVRRFSTFRDFKAQVRTRTGDKLVSWPVQRKVIDELVGPGWEPTFKGVPTNFEEAALAIMPRRIYDAFVKEYTEKQWGVPASELSPDLCRRFEVREGDSPFLKPSARYQGIPTDGYTSMMKHILSGITVLTDIDYLRERSGFKANKLTIFTGSIDEFFDYSLGRLKYRSQHRVTEYIPDIRQFQPVVQVNEPLHAHGPHIRTVEWRHLWPPESLYRSGTVITRETPCAAESTDRNEYPFPDEENRHLYRRYRAEADGLPNTLICGRLGEYKYFDMDHAIARALTLCQRVLRGWTPDHVLRGS